MEACPNGLISLGRTEYILTGNAVTDAEMYRCLCTGGTENDRKTMSVDEVLRRL